MLLTSAPPVGLFAISPPSREGEPEGARMNVAAPQPAPAGSGPEGDPGALIAAMARGDRAALGRLYDSLGRPLYSLAYRILNDAAEAQDVVHDAFLQLWQKAGEFDAARGTAFTWAATLVRNRAIDRVRMRQRRAEILHESAAEIHPPAAEEETSSADAAWLREKAVAVRAALGALAPEQRTAIELAFFSGLTQQEIAAQLNEPLGTIKARIRRGLLKLRERLPAHL
jgi:RNA polymerase sigma-70 factor (ECF subfamily)